MESELARQAELLFGKRATAPRYVPDAAAAEVRATADDGGEAVAPPENATPALRLNLTERQQRKLWHHVETIENFWETLAEIEAGAIARLAAVAAERRWEIIFL